MPFHYVFTQTLVSGAYSFNLQPANFPRVGTEADAWAHFRVKKLSFRLHRTALINGPQMGCYVGAVEDNTVATVASASEVLPSTFLSPVQVAPTEWVHVPKADLAGPFPWYKTISGTADPTEESPGQFAVVGTGTDTFYAEFRGTFEFKVSLATANTPAALKLRAEVREARARKYIESERAILLRVLSSQQSPTLGGLSFNQKASV